MIIIIRIFDLPCLIASEYLPEIQPQKENGFFAYPTDLNQNQTVILSENDENIFEKYFPGSKVGKPMVLIIVLILVIIYSILSMIILLVFMLIDRGRRDKKSRRKHQLREKYQAALVDYLDPEIDDAKYMERINDELHKPFNREVLINETIDLSINLQENEASKLQNLYFRLGLNNDSIKKCKSKRWHKRIKGYRECAFMNIDEAKPIVEKGLHSKNDIVRSEAQLAMVRLNTSDPYGFLDNLIRPFSVWEQNIVHEAITYHNLSIPDFKRWLNSDNISVIIFSIKMIQLFDQKDSWNDMITLLTHESDKVRNYVIQALGELQVEESQHFLRVIYEDEIPDNQIAVLQALAKFKDLTNLIFFKHTIEMEDNVWLQVEAAKGIQRLEDRGEKELLKLLDRNEYRNYQIIIKHVLDKRI